MERGLAYVENVAERENLIIEDCLPSVLDAAQRSAADFQAFHLELGRELLLRPSALVAEISNLLSDDVPVFHCS